MDYLDVKELLVQNRQYIWGLSESNGIGTKNNLARKQTLNHLAELPKRLSSFVSTYLDRAFVFMLLSCDLRVSEWIHKLESPWMSRNSFFKAGAISEV